MRPGAVALVHCRMSELGTVVGGAETVVRALLDAVGPEGTIVAYLGWEDAPPDDLEALSSPDREVVLAEQPVYDPVVGRARRDHGRLAEALRTWPGAVHSGHPEAGVAALGREARAIALPHPLDDAYGDGTPYARIVARGGQVVLLGAPLETATLVHHAEAVAQIEGKRRTAWRCPVLVDGRREWRTLHDIDTGSGALDYEVPDGRTRLRRAFRRAHACVRRRARRPTRRRNGARDRRTAARLGDGGGDRGRVRPVADLTAGATRRPRGRRTSRTA